MLSQLKETEAEYFDFCQNWNTFTEDMWKKLRISFLSKHSVVSASAISQIEVCS